MVIQMFNQVWQKTDDSVLLVSVDLRHCLNPSNAQKLTEGPEYAVTSLISLTLLHYKLQTDVWAYVTNKWQ
jgi:hypothetical protein